MLRGIVLIALAAMSWGTTGSVTTVLVRSADASPLVIGIARLWLAALLLAGAARFLAPPLGIDRADRWRSLLAGAAMAVFQAAYFTAVTLTGITIAALVAICSAPLVIAILAATLLGEQITGRIAIALVLGLSGTTLLVTGSGRTELAPNGFLGGAGLALLAGAAYATYAVITKGALARSRPLPLAAANFAAAAVLLTPALLWTDDPLRQIALGWPWLLYLGVIATAGAYALYTIGLRTTPASVAGIVTLLEPLTATLLGVLVFGERLGTAGTVGALLMFAALALLLVPGRRWSPATS
jgi:DME family drug/metabolite transporter